MAVVYAYTTNILNKIGDENRNKVNFSSKAILLKKKFQK